MSRNTVIVLTLAGAAVAIAYIYFSSKSTAQSSTGGSSVNSLPARQYSLNPFNANGQPQSPTFTAFSGVPVVEGLLSAFAGTQAQPTSSDSSIGAASVPIPSQNQIFGTGQVTVDDTQAGTTSFFG